MREATLLAAAAAIREAIGVPVRLSVRDSYLRDLDRVRAALGNAFEAAWVSGRAMTLDDVIAFASADQPLPPHAETATHMVTAGSDPGLSARELEVLKHLAEGKTNRQIASTLSLSHRTITTHVSNILGKLDLDSRTQAVAWALRHGVV